MHVTDASRTFAGLMASDSGVDVNALTVMMGGEVGVETGVGGDGVARLRDETAVRDVEVSRDVDGEMKAGLVYNGEMGARGVAAGLTYNGEMEARAMAAFIYCGETRAASVVRGRGMTCAAAMEKPTMATMQSATGP